MQNVSFHKTITRVLFGATLAFAGNALAFPIDYATTGGSSLNFDGSGNFSFNPALNSIQITSGSAVSLLGDISGTFAIGPITTVGAQSSAAVSGSGEFVIHDGASTLKGTLTIGQILQVGTGTTLNDQGTINLTGISYTGTNPDLLSLAATGSAIDVMTFQFATPVSLATMKSTSLSTSFSGSLFSQLPQVVPDGGATVMLLGLGLSALALVRRSLAA